MNRLSYQRKIDDGFAEWNLGFYFLKTIRKHLRYFMDGVLNTGFPASWRKSMSLPEAWVFPPA